MSHLTRTAIIDRNGVHGHRYKNVNVPSPATVHLNVSAAVAAVPRDRNPEFAAYFAATDRKHFGDRSEPGSKFLDPNLTRVEDVVALAATQRGDLNGDDRDRFIELGADPNAFADGNRYLYVETEGSVGVKDTYGLADDVLVDVVRTKPGVPCSLVLTVSEQETADYAVVILVEDRVTGEPMVITAFPGIVTKSVKHDELEAREGGTITLRDVRRILGADTFVNTRIRL